MFDFNCGKISCTIIIYNNLAKTSSFNCIFHFSRLIYDCGDVLSEKKLLTKNFYMNLDSLLAALCRPIMYLCNWQYVRKFTNILLSFHEIFIMMSLMSSNSYPSLSHFRLPELTFLSLRILVRCKLELYMPLSECSVQFP